METTRICKECRQPLPADAPEGLCPACLAKVALGSESAAAGATVNVSPLAGQAPSGTRVPPKVADLAAQFPQLEIIELLGMGGMGMVYKARQPRLDRLVALKILPIDSTRGASFAERFEREARALARLNHPGIVTLFDFGQTLEYYYFIMEYVDGMNLRQLLHTRPLEPRQALELVTQICTALQFAHDEKIVHRDIKPENILINKKGQVKIADFGLAKLLGNAPDTALTMSQAAMGTMNYMAPEQRQNAQGVDHRADIYSLGVVFYEMLTGEVPMGRFEPPSKRVQLDVRLDEVVLRALEREPARRYQQASEIKTGVETITSTIPAAQAPLTEPSSVPAKTPPKAVEIRVPTAIKVLLTFSFIPLAIACVSGFHGEMGTMLGILLSWGIILAAVIQIHSRRQIQQARARGLWPQSGELPSLDHIKRLAQAGQGFLAVKLYRQVHTVSWLDAKAAVAKLADPPSPAHKAEAAPAAALSATAVALQRRISKTALVGAAWAFGFFLFALVSLLIVASSHAPDGTRPVPASEVVRLLVLRWSQATASYTPWWQTVLMITIMTVGLTAPFGTTILGYLSLSQIRHSAGRLYGLGLAWFDALLFPMLLANLLAFVLMLSFYLWNGHSPADPSAPHAVSHLSPVPVFALAGLILVMLNFFIVRKVWRICRR